MSHYPVICAHKHTWSFQPFHLDYGLTSYTTFVVVYDSLIHEWRDLQFKDDSERQIIILKNFPWLFYLLFEFLPEICFEDFGAEIFANISFWYLIWSLNRGLTKGDLIPTTLTTTAAPYTPINIQYYQSMAISCISPTFVEVNISQWC